MNTNEIIKRLKVMLSLEEKEVTEKMKSLATLVDGTEVFVMEGEIAPGSILYVVTEGEEEVLAPEGLHETVDGLLVTVGEAGEIISVEPKAVEAPVEAPVEAGDYKDKVVEEDMEVAEIEVEAPAGADMATEALLEGMAELLKPFIEEVKVLTDEFKKMEQRFNAIADQPASTKIKTKLSANVDEVEKKIEILKKIRQGKK
jgi:hypothetical protein